MADDLTRETVLYAANTAAGTEDASTYDNRGLIGTAIAALAAPTAGIVELRICGDITVAATVEPSALVDGVAKWPCWMTGAALSAQTDASPSYAPVTIDADGGAFPVLTHAADFWYFFDLLFTNTDQGVGNHAVDLSSASDTFFTRCGATVGRDGFNTANEARFVDCWASGNVGNGWTAGADEVCVRCSSFDNTVGTAGSGHGFSDVRDCIDCLAYGNAGHGWRSASHQWSCTSYGNAGDGYNTDNRTNSLDCIAVANGGYGYVIDGNVAHVDRLATFGNATGRSNEATANSRLVDSRGIVLTADPFVDAASGDFTLAADAPLSLRAPRYQMPGGLSTYRSVGALTLGAR